MQKTEFYFSSSDEIHDIHAVVWRPEGDVRAVLQISHGMTEYVNRYEELAEYLTARAWQIRMWRLSLDPISRTGRLCPHCRSI